MAIVRTFPRGPWWQLALGMLLIFAGIIGAAVLASPWPLGCVLFSGVGVVVFFEARGLRCPQCGRRLTDHKVPVDDGPAYRIFLECKHCEALWDSEIVFDPRGS